MLYKPDIPEKPGVYLFKEGQNILYIGKAKNLKKRVDQYFQKREHGIIRNLLNQADDLEFIVTDSERDALLLEYNLVHHYQPPFNIRLKDDKSFPFIKITTGDEYPGIYFTRDTSEKHFYVGPIVDSRKTRDLIDTITRIFKIRVCNDSLFNRHTGCIYYYIDRCSAPCIDKISREDYLKDVENAIEFFKGHKSKIIDHLQKEMMRLSDEMRFEEAQKIKEDILLMQRFVLDSYISSVRKSEFDVIGFYHEPNRTDSYIILFSVQEGRVRRKEFFNFDSVHTTKEEILKDFLISFYGKENIPSEILVRFLPEDSEALEEIFSKMAGRQVQIKLPMRGDKRKLLNLTVKNLNLFIGKKDFEAVGNRLKEELHLVNFPSLIEGFDISHFSERERVGAVVVFSRGEPIKKKYRNYIIKQAAAGDTEALKEVLERRFKDRIPEEQPDLLLIDGGKGQLSAALSIKHKLNLRSDVIALAKEEERVFTEYHAPDGSENSVLFPDDSPERFLLQNVRDEVHRRAISHHRNRRSANLFKSKTRKKE